MPSCACTDVVLDSIIRKLQCSVFYGKRAMNRVLAFAITLILGNKQHLSIVIYFLL